MSNAIRHASPLPGTLIEVTWGIDQDSVEIRVSDGGGATKPEPSGASLEALGGRGLTIVQHLACRWGVSNHASRSTVWAVMPAPRPGTGAAQRGAGSQAGWS